MRMNQDHAEPKPKKLRKTSAKAILVLVFLFMTIGLGYQNCAPSGDFTSVAASSQGTGANTNTGSSSNGSSVIGQIGSNDSYVSATPTPTPSAGELQQSLMMNGQAGSTSVSSPTLVRGDVDLLYSWSCENCVRADVPTYVFGGDCGSSGAADIDWMTGLSGQHTVPGSSSRVGCWINITRTVYSATGQLTRTFFFRWTAPQTTNTLDQWVTMNGITGGATAQTRANVAGNLDLRYTWGCTGCESADIPTYEFGGSCGSSGSANIDWMTGTSGEFWVPGSASREGCWINITRTVRKSGQSPLTKTFYFNWVPGPAADTSAPPSQWITMNGIKGGTSPSTRVNIKGDQALRYIWHCSNCTSTSTPTYRFGGNCPGGSGEGSIDWMNSTSGEFIVSGSADRVGCWLDVTRTVSGPTGTLTQTFYFNWVQ